MMQKNALKGKKDKKLNFLQRGKSTVNTAASATAQVASIPLSNWTKGKKNYRLNSVHDHYHSEFLENVTESEPSRVAYYHDDAATESFVSSSDFTVNILRYSCFDTSVASPLHSHITDPKLLVIDDLQFEHRFDRALQINKYSIKESIQMLQNTEFKYLDPLKGNITERFQMWVEEGGSVLSYFQPNNALSAKVRIQRRLMDVLEIRLGHKTKAFEREPPTRKNHCPELPKNSFSLIFCDTTLDLVAYSIQDWQTWLNVLVRLIVHWKSEPPIYQALRPFWVEFKNGLTFEGLIEVLHSLNLSMKNSKKLLELMGYNKKNAHVVTFTKFAEELQRFWNYLPFGELFQGLVSSIDAPISDARFTDFLVKVQKEEVSLETVRERLKFFRKPEEFDQVTIATFDKYLNSKFNHAFNAENLKVQEDMMQPLHHYYINSSHNTYCSSKQLVGDSKVDMYRQLLLRSVRCIELDCWDGEDGEPIVYHGYTMTTKLYVVDICEVIRDYSFITSPYPVILSIENHCSESQQQRLAEIFISTFGDSIFASPEDFSECFPPLSPSQLKHKILVKGKVSNIAFSQLMFMRSVKLSKNFQGNAIWYNCYSMTETEQASYNAESLLELNRTMFTRIYPAGDRVDSSNFRPDKCWLAGCQMVALNLQTPDVETFKNFAKFADNGGSGYLLKPIYQRISFDTDEIVRPAPIKLRVTVLGARNLPKRANYSVHPYVTVSMFGSKKDQMNYRTLHVKGDGFVPGWNATMDFILEDFDNALLVFQVWDNKMSSGPAALRPQTTTALIAATGVVTLVGVGAATTVLTGGAAIPLVGTAALVAVGGTAASIAANQLAAKLAFHVIPVRCLRRGYRMVELYDWKTPYVPIPMCDMLCRFEFANC